MLVTIVSLPKPLFFSNCICICANVVRYWQIFYFAALAYFLFKLTRIYASENELTFNSIRTALTIFAVMTIILLLVTIANACWCTFNFNKGLKDHIYAGKRTKLIDKDDKMEMPALASPQAHRMEID